LDGIMLKNAIDPTLNSEKTTWEVGKDKVMGSPIQKKNSPCG